MANQSRLNPMQVFSRVLFAVVSICVTSACSTQTAQVGPSKVDLPAVSMDRAFATFADLCYQSAPSFRSFDTKTREYKPSSNGWLNHASVSFSVALRESADNYSCQVAFKANEGKRAFVSIMNSPFNARELTKQEISQLFQKDGGEPVLQGGSAVLDMLFLSKTNFDGKPASFFGIIFEDTFFASTGDQYGLMVQVSK